MRLLFISGTAVAGSGRSQRELAVRLAERGHGVTLLVDDGKPHRLTRFTYEQLSDLSARLGERSPFLLRWLEGRPGRRTRSEMNGGVEHLWTPVPENAAPVAINKLRPDVVVGNSVLRLTWRKVRSMCEEQRIATVLYVREVAALNHFDLGVPPADLNVANATTLAEAVIKAGYECDMLPSVINTSVTLTESTRRVALMINPIESHGIELVWQLADALPGVPFVLQESWPLDPKSVASIEAKSATRPNVELRRARLPGPDLYRDARVLLVPHRLDNRPRVVAEAQANGIPVIASDYQGLVEAVGDGGVLLPPDEFAEWQRETESLWNDTARYEDLRARAERHSKRSEIDPVAVVDRFEVLLDKAISAARAGHSIK